MSNFLNKFSKESYSETLSEKEKAAQALIEETPVEKEEKSDKSEKSDKKDKKKKKEEKEKKQAAVEPEPYVEPVRHRVHDIEETTKDPNYKRSRNLKIIGYTAGAIAVLVLGFMLYFFMNQVKVPDYLNQPLSDLQTWANRNNITLDVQREYSLDVNENSIISVNPLPNAKVQKGSIIEVVVSDGADPEEVIVIPDFTGFASYQIQDWININDAYNLRMNWENSDDVPSDQFIRIKFNDQATTNENYQRKDYGIVYISSGPIYYEKNIEVPDWVTAHVNIATVSAWATQNGIELIVNKVNSAVTVDGVVSQSLSPKTMIAKKDKITVSISLGLAITVPDFSKITMESAQSEANGVNNADITIVRMYNDDSAYGNFIWQDVAAGTKVNQTNPTPLPIRVYYSLGKPFIDSMIGSSESGLPMYFYNLNQNSAKLTYTVNYVNSCTLADGTVYDASYKGKICSMSAFNQYVTVGSNITITVYQP